MLRISRCQISHMNSEYMSLFQLDNAKIVRDITGCISVEMQYRIKSENINHNMLYIRTCNTNSSRD